MEVSKDVYKKLRDMVAEFNANKAYELETKYTGRLTKESFAHVIQYLRSNDFKEVVHPETLDILFQNADKRSFRLSVSGKDAIQEYCLYNRLAPKQVTSAMSKKFVDGFRSIILDEFGAKVDLREEASLSELELQEACIAVEKALKGYRYKKRFSYTDSSKQFRFDCTVVRRSKDINKQFMAHPKFAVSGVTQSIEQYEVEIECIHRGKVEDTTKQMLHHVAELYTVANGLPHFLSKTQKESILKGYLGMWMKSSMANIDFEQVRLKPRRYFIGPQPVTLEQKNVVTDGIGVNTILKDYTVTEKADGERCLFYIHSNHQGYFLNSKLEVIPSGMTFANMAPCIMDGEYITRDASGNKIKVYAFFDVYFFNGKNVMSLPLLSDDEKVESRLAILNEFKDKYKDRLLKETGVVFYVKRFLHGDIFREAKRLLDEATIGSFIYRIDGLIFTPKSLAVGGEFKGDQGDMMGAWNKLYKWKPPSENTIDFQVREQKDEYGKVKVTARNNKVYKMHNLLVGFKPSQWDGITAKAYLDKKIVKNHAYMSKLFTPPEETDPSICEYYAEVDDQGVCRCKNGDEIQFNSIVEFAYVNDASIAAPFRWVPLRVRKDKVSPNDFGPAINVWRSIHYPVTEENIAGKVPILSKDLPDEQVYYKRSIQRDKFASKTMMNFHTYWNKNILMIQGYCKGAKSLLDLACGKGGDIRKWVDAGIENVLGVDSVRDNIENPIDGAYARMIENKLQDKNYAFITMDASKVLDKYYIDQMQHEEDRLIAQKLWGLVPNDNSKYWGMAASKFEAVTCMFAVHYFFKSEKMLDAFLKNVANNLADGGVFLGTCLDGKRVKQALQNIAYKQSLTGRSEKDDRIMWNIQKLYTNEDVVDIGYNEEVRIYMESIGMETSEPLVNMSLLVQKLAKYDIHPVKIQSFEESYKQILELPVDTNNKVMMQALQQMSEAEKQYSFLNSFFVFRKGAVSSKVPSPKKADVVLPVQNDVVVTKTEAPVKKKLVIKKAT